MTDELCFVDAEGFAHIRYMEWVGYPMYACTCGHRWPCEWVQSIENERPPRAWCDQSNRVLSGHDWTDHQRMACPGCGKRVTVVAGRVPQHRPPEEAR